jgi:hypothetical protein
MNEFYLFLYTSVTSMKESSLKTQLLASCLCLSCFPHHGFRINRAKDCDLKPLMTCQVVLSWSLAGGAHQETLHTLGFYAAYSVMFIASIGCFLITNRRKSRKNAHGAVAIWEVQPCVWTA